MFNGYFHVAIISVSKFLCNRIRYKGLPNLTLGLQVRLNYCFGKELGQKSASPIWKYWCFANKEKLKFIPISRSFQLLMRWMHFNEWNGKKIKIILMQTICFSKKLKYKSVTWTIVEQSIWRKVKCTLHLIIFHNEVNDD